MFQQMLFGAIRQAAVAVNFQIKFAYGALLSNFISTGFLDSTGNFQRDVIFEKLSIALGGTSDPEVVKNLNELIDTCTKLTGPGECGTAFEVQNCYWRKIKGQ